MGRKPFRFMGRDPVSKLLQESGELDGLVDKSEWRHVVDTRGHTKCGAPADETPKSVGIEKRCAECMKVVYRALYGGK